MITTRLSVDSPTATNGKHADPEAVAAPVAPPIADHQLGTNRTDDHGDAEPQRFPLDIPTIDTTLFANTPLRETIAEIWKEDKGRAGILAWFYDHVLVPANKRPEQVRKEELANQQARFDYAVKHNKPIKHEITRTKKAETRERRRLAEEEASLLSGTNSVRVHAIACLAEIGVFADPETATEDTLLLPKPTPKNAAYSLLKRPFVPADREIGIPGWISWTITVGFGAITGTTLGLATAAMEWDTVFEQPASIFFAVAGIAISVTTKQVTKVLTHIATEQGILHGKVAAWLPAALMTAVDIVVMVALDTCVQQIGLLRGISLDHPTAYQGAHGGGPQQSSLAITAIASIFSLSYAWFTAIEGHLSGRKHVTANKVEEALFVERPGVSKARIDLPDKTRRALFALMLVNEAKCQVTAFEARKKSVLEQYDSRMKALTQSLLAEEFELGKVAIERDRDVRNRQRSTTLEFFELLRPIHEPMSQIVANTQNDAGSASKINGVASKGSPKQKSLWQRIVAVFKP